MKRRESSLRAAAAALLLLGAALLFFRLVLYRQPAAVPLVHPLAAPASREPASDAVVMSVSGDVQRSTGGSWAALSAGERLGENAEVRTGQGARTDLRLGEHDSIILTESSDVIIQSLSADVRRLRLRRGRISVDAQDPAAPPLRVEDESGAVAEARKARFSVLSTGTAIAVATESGEVALSSGMHTVAVSAGMESVAQRGQAPAAPRPLPARIVLQVANALIGASVETCAELDGAVPDDAELTVDGVPTLPDAQGRFHLKVPRARGKKSVLVSMRDASGQTRTREVPCAPGQAEVRDVAIKWRESP